LEGDRMMEERCYRVSTSMTKALSRLMAEREAIAGAKKHIADWLVAGRVVTAEMYYQGDLHATPCKVFRDGVVLDRYEEADRTREKRIQALRMLKLRPTVISHIVNMAPTTIRRLAKVKGVGAKTIERAGEDILRVISTRWCDL